MSIPTLPPHPPYPTYDSSKTGPRYTVEVFIDGRELGTDRLDDPFARTHVYITRKDLLRGLLRGQVHVVVKIGADEQMIADVIGLDEQYADPGLRNWQRGFVQALLAAAARPDPAGNKDD